ncbi:MAG: bifunctional 5,10-methylenetetrahydrofolate dehydrogenase/5,10-methenyltetrahydrofolate cyclohydrolase [Patescibacteria group bacterium]
MIILDGKKVASEITEKLAKKIDNLKNKGIIPNLHIYLVGDNPSSLSYIGVKQKKASALGVKCVVKRFVAETSPEEIISSINADNQDPDCHGIIVQLPLPNHLDPNILLQVIDIDKDVDGLTYINQWKLLNNIPGGFFPATAKGIISLLDFYQIPIAGQKAVIIGRSRLVGLPTALLMLHQDATVTICHRQTPDLTHETTKADILIVAAGQPNLIKAAHVKKDAVIVDVGITKISGSQLTGDVDFFDVKSKSKAVSPVPGGVGPMTVVSLFENLLEAVEKQTKSFSGRKK